MAGILVAVPAIIASLQQQGLLERAFHDGLFPNLAYRAEAMPEEWPLQTGQQIFMTRPGLLKPQTQPLQPGTDPIGQTVPFEQWVATLNQFADSVDIHMPTAVTTNANLFLRYIHQLGLGAGQSINRIARNALFQAYLSGNTVTTTAPLTGDTVLQVASLNGFTQVVSPGGSVAPQTVSPAYPLPITLYTPSGTTVALSITGYTPSNPNDLNAPGTLQLAAGTTVGVSGLVNRTPVISAYAPRIIRSAAGNSIDAIGQGDTLVLQQVINAVGFLRQANVQPHEDGFYHAHIAPTANAQIFNDPVFQRLNQSLPEHVVYKEGFIGTISNVMFFMNSESPLQFNTGTLTGTSSSGQYAQEIGAEVLNGNGIQIGRTIITGRGAMYEKYLDEGAFTTEAGLVGKTGEFDVINNGVNILTERIRMILRAPQDKLQQVVTATWSITTSFPVPSDITAPSGPQLYKRAIVLEHAA
jgi:hypothetical protein